MTAVGCRVEMFFFFVLSGRNPFHQWKWNPRLKSGPGRLELPIHELVQHSTNYSCGWRVVPGVSEKSMTEYLLFEPD